MYTKNQQCFPCMSNCLNCTSPDSCLKCFPSFYLNKETAKCESCQPDCHVCSNSASCQICSPGFQKDETTGLCFEVFSLAGNGFVSFDSLNNPNESTEIILKFDTGLTGLDSSDSFKKNPYSEDEDLKVNIPGCWKMKTESECQFCLNGFYKSGKVCDSCEVNCFKCFSKDKCYQCRLGFVLEKDSVNLTRCVKHKVNILY